MLSLSPLFCTTLNTFCRKGVLFFRRVALWPLYIASGASLLIYSFYESLVFTVLLSMTVTPSHDLSHPEGKTSLDNWHYSQTTVLSHAFKLNVLFFIHIIIRFVAQLFKLAHRFISDFFSALRQSNPLMVFSRISLHFFYL